MSTAASAAAGASPTLGSKRRLAVYSRERNRERGRRGKNEGGCSLKHVCGRERKRARRRESKNECSYECKRD